MNEPGPCPFTREVVEMPARLAQTDPPQADGTDGELAADEMGERDAGVRPDVDGNDGACGHESGSLRRGA